MQQNLLPSRDRLRGNNLKEQIYLGKDLQDMTKEKTLQCLGRIGRGHIQQNYTIFRLRYSQNYTSIER